MLKDLLGPATRVKKKKKSYGSTGYEPLETGYEPLFAFRMRLMLYVSSSFFRSRSACITGQNVTNPWTNQLRALENRFRALGPTDYEPLKTGYEPLSAFRFYG